MKDDVSQQRDSARKAANERTRRYRKRQDEGIGIAPTPYTDEITDMLIDYGWLPLPESEDRRVIGEAIFAMLSEAASTRKR